MPDDHRDDTAPKPAAIPQLDEESCDNCIFSWRPPGLGLPRDMRKCRRFPPTTAHVPVFQGPRVPPQWMSYSDYVPVDKTAWCGEYRRKLQLH